MYLNVCGTNNKDEDNCPKTLNDKNHQASSQKFRQQTHEEGRRTYQLKRCGNNNKDEDNCPKTFNDKNHQASFQKLRQLVEEGKKFVFWFGAQFDSTLYFTQSGWTILFTPDLLFPGNRLVKLPNTLFWAGERRPVQTSHRPFFNSVAF